MFDGMIEHPIGRRLRPIAILAVGAFYLHTLSNCLLFGDSEPNVVRVIDEWHECLSGTSRNLYGIAGHVDGSVVAVGAGGVVLESVIEPTNRDIDAAAACGQWVDISPATTVTLRGAWMPDITTVWAAGGDGESGTGRVLRYDGDDWIDRDGPTFVTYNRIWGRSECDMYFLGGGIATDLPNGAHFDCGLMDGLTVDIGWSEITDVSGTSPEDIWVVMNQTTYNVWHYNGAEWENHWQEWMDQPLYGVYALSPTEVVAVGANGTVYWFIDGEWEDESPAGVDTDLYDVWGWRRNTKAWSRQDGLRGGRGWQGVCGRCLRRAGGRLDGRKPARHLG